MENNNIQHPKHYNREGGMECIDEMILIFGKEAVKDFCLCNAWKYRYRAADKNGTEDLAKSDWYINKYKELTNSYIISTIPAEKSNIDDSKISITPLPNYYERLYGSSQGCSNDCKTHCSYGQD